MDLLQGNKRNLTPIWSRPWVLILLILLVYANSWGNPFILDDVTHIRDDPRLLHWQNWTEVFSSPFFQFKEAGLAQYYRPLVKLTYKIERFFFGINPFGYHLVNTALHCLNALFLYLICRIIMGRPAPAFIAALIFGIHPLQVEEVSYISGLGGLTAVSGILISIYYFLRFRSERKTSFYILSIIFFVLGLLFKESAMILPVLLIWVMIVYRLKRS
ncbi:MAG: glycosyltransferase family 39 protein, partial [Candidatus Auribacterota bacterium]|nr:glycosyltransferase family 39 protein [Candidatus Auribacterota bacterium]